MKKQKRLPFKVVSIGNITVGGTGKTPAVIALAEEARKRGYSPVVLTRGYKGRVKGPVFVASPRYPLKNFSSNPHNIAHTVRDAGDEPVLMAERLKNIPIVKCANRYDGGVFALRGIPFEARKPFLFILDDGFQHWMLHRDVDILLVDGSNPFGNKKLLPLGPLREPLEELRRADIFVITKVRNEELKAELKDKKPEAPLYFSGHRLVRIRDAAGNTVSAGELGNRKLYAFCGIANPESFRQTVLSLTERLSGFKAYGDHYRYTAEDVLSLGRQCRDSGCDFLVTTEKDMVKLRELNVPERILYLEIGFSAEPAFYDDVFRRLAHQVF